MAELTDLYAWVNGSTGDIPVDRTDEVYVDSQVFVNLDYDNQGTLIGVEIVGADSVTQNPRPKTPDPKQGG